MYFMHIVLYKNGSLAHPCFSNTHDTELFLKAKAIVSGSVCGPRIMRVHNFVKKKVTIPSGCLFLVVDQHLLCGHRLAVGDQSEIMQIVKSRQPDSK